MAKTWPEPLTAAPSFSQNGNGTLLAIGADYLYSSALSKHYGLLKSLVHIFNSSEAALIYPWPIAVVCYLLPTGAACNGAMHALYVVHGA